MGISTKSELASAIAEAAENAFSNLFQSHPGKFYYCSLVTTGEAHAPVVTAWSEEALRNEVSSEPDAESAMAALRWSPADSPFYAFGEAHFENVRDFFAQRPPLTWALSEAQWDAEYDFRLEAMEEAMRILDARGLFGKGKDRQAVVVLVEVMPPDHTNTQRALRLNPREAINDWLVEAAEDSNDNQNGDF